MDKDDFEKLVEFEKIARMTAEPGKDLLTLLHKINCDYGDKPSTDLFETALITLIPSYFYMITENVEMAERLSMLFCDGLKARFPRTFQDIAKKVKEKNGR